jgi:uncharacterized membrane protein
MLVPQRSTSLAGALSSLALLAPALAYHLVANQAWQRENEILTGFPHNAAEAAAVRLTADISLLERLSEHLLFQVSRLCVAVLGLDVEALLLAPTLLFLAGIVVVAELSRQLSGTTAGVAAGWLFAFTPGIVAISRSYDPVAELLFVVPLYTLLLAVRSARPVLAVPVPCSQCPRRWWSCRSRWLQIDPSPANSRVTMRSGSGFASRSSPPPDWP